MSQHSAHGQGSSQDSIITSSLDNHTTFIGSRYSDVAGVGEQNNNSGDSLGGSPLYFRKIFWLGCTGFFIIALAIILPILILEIFPDIVQKVLDQSQLEITEMSILAPITDTAFNFSSKGEITKARSFGAFIDFQGPIDIYWENSLIGNLNFTAIQLSHGDAGLFENSTFTITDETRFGDFTVHQLNNETFSWTLVGKPTVTAFGLSKKDLHFNKTITLAGCGFQNLSITNYQINVTSLTQQITANFINASPITIQLGTVGYKFLYNNTLIGWAEASNITVVPGVNTLIMEGPINTDLTLDKLKEKISTLIKVESGSTVTVTVIGDFAKPDGVNTVSWLQQGIQSLVFQASITKPRFIF